RRESDFCRNSCRRVCCQLPSVDRDLLFCGDGRVPRCKVERNFLRTLTPTLDHSSPQKKKTVYFPFFCFGDVRGETPHLPVPRIFVTFRSSIEEFREREESRRISPSERVADHLLTIGGSTKNWKNIFPPPCPLLARHV
ncbi:unnamed protein product, partial [Larinioides sclopetarius]